MPTCSHDLGSRSSYVVALRVRGTVPIARCVVADRPMLRLRGLLGRAPLRPGEGLLLVPCSAVHTVGMRTAIDAVFLGRDGCVLRVVERLEPVRLASCRGARAVVELPAGEARRTGVERGERVVLVADRAGVDGASDPLDWPA